MKKTTTIAAAVATMLIAGSAALAGAGSDVEQDDPFGNGNWNAQGPLQLGSDVEQDDPYGNGNWNAQGPLQLGSDVDQNPGGNGEWRAQPSQQLTNRQRTNRRQAPRFPQLCNSRVIRMIFDARDIELDCP